MRKLFLALALTLIATPAMAGTVRVGVNGLVCAFCITAIQNSFEKKEGVKSTNVDMDSKIVTIDFVDGKEMTDAQLTETFTDAGYTTTKIER